VLVLRILKSVIICPKDAAECPHRNVVNIGALFLGIIGIFALLAA
jgi:hypothetical protein